MRPFLQNSVRKAYRCFVGTSCVEVCEPLDSAQTLAENGNIKDKLTEMLISTFYFAKAVSAFFVYFGFTYFYPDSKEKVSAAEVIAMYKQCL